MARWFKIIDGKPFERTDGDLALRSDFEAQAKELSLLRDLEADSRELLSAMGPVISEASIPKAAWLLAKKAKSSLAALDRHREGR